MNTCTMARTSEAGALELEKLEQKLRAWFALENLEPDSILSPPSDPFRRVALLGRLAEWVSAWRVHGDRRKMEALGYDFPPVDPDYDPDTDWLLFERWMRRQPLQWSLADEVRDYEPADRIDEALAGARAAYLQNEFESRGVSLDLPRELPDRVRYACLLGVARDQRFHYVAPGSSIVLGCDAYCPSCLQRLWCEIGLEMDWPEDEDAGELVVPDELKKLAKQGCAKVGGRRRRFQVR